MNGCKIDSKIEIPLLANKILNFVIVSVYDNKTVGSLKPGFANRGFSYARNIISDSVTCMTS